MPLVDSSASEELWEREMGELFMFHRGARGWGDGLCMASVWEWFFYITCIVILKLAGDYLLKVCF